MNVGGFGTPRRFSLARYPGATNLTEFFQPALSAEVKLISPAIVPAQS
jgi:hypothetical protein